MKKTLALVLTLFMGFVIPTNIHAEDTVNPATFTEDGGYEDEQPKTREIYDSLERTATYYLYNTSNGSKKVATKRKGDSFLVNGSWVARGSSFPIEIIDTAGQTIYIKNTKKLYSEAYILSKLATGRSLKAGTYKITKKCLDTYYVDNGDWSGWIEAGVGDVSVVGTKSLLDATSINGVPVKTKLIPLSFNIRPGYGTKVKYVTIHNTANTSSGASAAAHASLQYDRGANNDSVTTSWHFTVDNKEIWQSIPMNETAYHAADGYGMGNDATVAIEICENSDGNYKKAEENAAYLTAKILYENGLADDAVRMHKDWSGKHCAHNILDMTNGSMGWTKFLAKVKTEYKKIKDADVVYPESIVVSSENMVVSRNNRYQLSAKVLPANATNAAITWKSNDDNIVTVDSKGQLLAKNLGTCYVYAMTSNGKQARIKVTVKMVPVQTITINPENRTIGVGETFTPTTQITPSNASFRTVVWSSNSEQIATVDAKGQITGKKAGSVYIYAKTREGIYTRIKIVVSSSIKSEKIALSTTAKTLKVGQTFTPTYTITPANATNKAVTWISNSSSIATVDSKGKITAKKKGKTYIYVRTADGKTDRCLVTVN